MKTYLSLRQKWWVNVFLERDYTRYTVYLPGEPHIKVVSVIRDWLSLQPTRMLLGKPQKWLQERIASTIISQIFTWKFIGQNKHLYFSQQIFKRNNLTKKSFLTT